MKLPTVVFGAIFGGVMRVESCGGEEYYFELDHPFLFFKRPIILPQVAVAVTHLQKKSRFGFLLMSHEKWWQLCFHIWLTFRFQQELKAGGYVPGSERVLYWRAGYSRWDAGDCKYVIGETKNIFGWRFTIPFGTWYGPGLHWD